jgi:peptidyl-prolyl cis-trans isomerase B (cyclophilin B)
MNLVTLLTLFFSILIPTKTWYRPDEPLLVNNTGTESVQLIAVEMFGAVQVPDAPPIVEAGAQADVRKVFPSFKVGTYLLYAVPVGKKLEDGFVGTPLVLQFRGDDRPGAMSGTIVIKVEPLSVAKITTSKGEMTLAFYYNVAPNTVSNFVDLSRGGYYDGITFHRVVPGFVVQGGDPTGTGAGGPGYNIDAEFNTEQHTFGVISMARQGDPNERSGAMPRPEFANTASSQFFLCLDYNRTKALDNKYTAFGKIVAGQDVLRALGSVEIADPATGRPVDPPVIQKIEILPVTPEMNPYAKAFNLAE